MTFVTVHCPHCDSEQIVKRGKTRRGTQRYLCQNIACITGSFLLDYRNRGCVPEVKRQIIDMSLNASGVRDTARSLHISPTTVLRELKKKEAVLESVNAALLSFTKAMADVGQRDGVQVNAINPGPVKTARLERRLEQLAQETLPTQFGYEWTELSLQEILAGNSAVYIFPLCALFVFLVLAAQYESWSLPLAIILIVPMCLFAAISGVFIRGSDNNIFTQIGFVVLIGLACKNAILIVEFAKQQMDEGRDRQEAAVEASRLRLRPILMTSFAFTLGVFPLVRAVGAGAEMRQALGTAVFSGMIGVTFFGIFLTPVFFSVIMKLFAGAKKPARVTEIVAEGQPAARH